MSAPNLHTLPSEILKDILDEAFADSEIRISRHHKNGPALIQELILEYFGAFFQLVDPEPPTLPSLVKSRRRPQASSHAHFFVANALNNCFGPLAVCRRLYQESFQVFWERTTFVLEEGVTCADLCDWIPDFWKPHIARVQTEGHHLLFTELRGTLGLHGLKKLCLRDCDITQAPPVIFEISGKTSKKAEELILLCRASFLDEMAFRRRTMANLAKLAPFLDIVMSFPVAVYYTDNLGGTWSTYTETFGGWLPDIVSWLASGRGYRGSC